MGGYGLQLNTKNNQGEGVIKVAEKHGQLGLITKLAKSKSEYLSSLPVEEIKLALELTENDPKSYLVHFELRMLLGSGSGSALALANICSLHQNKKVLEMH